MPSTLIFFALPIILGFFQSTSSQEKFTLLASAVVDGPAVPQVTTPVYQRVQTTKVPLQKLACPRNPRIPIFSLPCYSNKDCKVFGPNLACCKDRCITGVLVPATPPPSRIARITNDLEERPVFRPSSSTPFPVVVAITPTTTTTVSSTTLAPTTTTVAAKAKIVRLACPSTQRRPSIFSLPCNVDKDCKVFGKGLLCCANRCLQGVVAPEPIQHSPALFGLVDRSCPADPLTEIFDIKECTDDSHCTPRICCPEKNYKGKSYCRTPFHKIENLPGGRPFTQPFSNIISYMQCTSPPSVDLFPKPCQSTLDCFPNLCCQENGKKYCRPPKRSIFNFVADVTSRIGASDVSKRIIQRITS